MRGVFSRRALKTDRLFQTRMRMGVLESWNVDFLMFSIAIKENAALDTRWGDRLYRASNCLGPLERAADLFRLMMERVIGSLSIHDMKPAVLLKPAPLVGKKPSLPFFFLK
ncbi:MAG: hypothetical protein JKY78_00030 [Hyphomonas sp.]|nr:hypothetical protein [Hyphomonas sp.]